MGQNIMVQERGFGYNNNAPDLLGNLNNMAVKIIDKHKYNVVELEPSNEIESFISNDKDDISYTSWSSESVPLPSDGSFKGCGLNKLDCKKFIISSKPRS